MKQQCHISFIYASWFILIAGVAVYLLKGDFIQAALWLVFIYIAMRAYARYFPRISNFMGYGSVEDKEAEEVRAAPTQVTLYTGVGCPFCPIVRSRLDALQKRMGFELREIDVTLKPDLLMKKGIRALPVLEVGSATLIGNATSDELSKFILGNVKG